MLIEELKRTPILRALVPMITGIIFARHLGTFLLVSCTILILTTIILCFVFLFYNNRLNPSSIRFHGFLIQVILFIAGMVSYPRHDSVSDINYSNYSGRICSDIIKKENSFSLVLDRISYENDMTTGKLKTRVQVYIQPGQNISDLEPGMIMNARGVLRAYEIPGKRREFDYPTYLAGKGILYTGYLDSLSWVSIPGNGHGSVKIIALNLRRHLLGVLKENRPPGLIDEEAILASLLLGYRGELQADTRQHFTEAGAMHILAISGLHVGILYFLPFLIIRKIRGSLFLRISLSVLLLLLLWAYAMLAGMSPSVTRAVGMCSIYEMARISGRKLNPMQVMSLSAFIIVIIRPSVVFESGFQLSFLAVTGIILFYRRLNNLLTITRSLPRWCWRITSLSFSAQIGTAPMVLYNFGQYPNYSLISNLVMIPLATMILYNGILFLSFSWIPAISGSLSPSLYFLAKIMNFCTGFAARIPGASSGNISISAIQVIIIYTIIFIIYLYLEKRHRHFLLVLMFSLFLYFSASSFLKYNDIRKSRDVSGNQANKYTIAVWFH
jgi:competence protein ComEC